MLAIYSCCTECGFSITPNEGPPILRITLDLVRNISRIEEHFRALTFTSDNRTLVDARIVVSNDTINGSFCHIASLEVYRGSKQSVVISHDGFSLSDEGNLLVNPSYSEMNDVAIMLIVLAAFDLCLLTC